MMPFNPRKVRFFSLEHVRNDHCLLSIQSTNHFLCICGHFSKQLRHYLPLPVWYDSVPLNLSCVAYTTQYISSICIKRCLKAPNPVHEEAVKWGQLFPSRGWGSFVQMLMSENAEVRRSTILPKHGGFLVLLKFWKRIMPKKPFVSASYHILFFEDVSTIICFLDTAPKAITEEPLFGTFWTSFGRSQPHSRRFWSLTRKDTENLKSLENSTRLKNSRSILSSLWQYYSNQILSCLSNALNSRRICSLYQ